MHASRVTLYTYNGALHAGNGTLHASRVALHANNEALHASRAMLYANNGALLADSGTLHASRVALHAYNGASHGHNAALRAYNVAPYAYNGTPGVYNVTPGACNVTLDSCNAARDASGETVGPDGVAPQSPSSTRQAQEHVMVKVVYADFNNFDEHGALPLSCNGSRASIQRIGMPLADGEQVMLSDGELMIVANVQQRPDGTWIAHCIGDFSKADERTRTNALESSAYPYPVPSS